MNNSKEDRLLAEFSAIGYTDFADDMREKIEMMKRATILANHKFAIKQVSENGRIRWRTNLPDESGKRGQQLKRKTRKELEDAIIQFYRGLEIDDRGPTFKDVYYLWREYYFEVNDLSPNTMDKYVTDYNRFFKDKPFEDMPIQDIDEEDLERFFSDLARNTKSKKGESGLLYKAFGKAFGYVQGTFRYAFKHKLIDKDPMIFLDKTSFRKRCRVPEEKTAETELIADNVFDMILNQIYEDIKAEPTNFSFYAVEFVAKTGLRVGEVATLRWEDVDLEKGYLVISRSDKCHVKRDADGNIVEREWTYSGTKTKKSRRFPIDESIKKSLRRIKKAQMEYGCVSEWLFPHPEYGWTHSSMISSCLKNKCKQIGLPRTYGIHAFRKTLNSDMRNNNASAKICSSMLGNSPEVNDHYYYYDNSDMETKRNYVEEAHAKRAFA